MKIRGGAGDFSRKYEVLKRQSILKEREDPFVRLSRTKRWWKRLPTKAKWLYGTGIIGTKAAFLGAAYLSAKAGSKSVKKPQIKKYMAG